MLLPNSVLKPLVSVEDISQSDEIQVSLVLIFSSAKNNIMRPLLES